MLPSCKRCPQSPRSVASAPQHLRAQGIFHTSARAAQEVLIAIHAHTGRVGTEATRADAQHDVLGFGIVFVDIVRVAGSNDRQAHAFGDLHRAFELHALDLDTIVHDLNEVAIAEYIVEPTSDLARFAFDFGGIDPLSNARG